MEYTFSDKISSLQPSAIREILKATADPKIIPLAAGNPAPDAFPVEEVGLLLLKFLTLALSMHFNTVCLRDISRFVILSKSG